MRMWRSKRLLSVAAAGVALTPSAAPGGTAKPFTLASTKRCLNAQPLVTKIAHSNDVATSHAIGGALNVTLRTRNTVAIGFYRTANDAAGSLRTALKVAKSYGVNPSKREAHTAGTALIGWANEPTAAEVRAVEGCLR